MTNTKSPIPTELPLLKEVYYKVQMDVMTCQAEVTRLERAMSEQLAKLKSLKSKLADIRGEICNAGKKYAASLPQ